MDKHKQVRDSVVALDANDEQFWHSLLDLARENVSGFADLLSLLAVDGEEFHRCLTDKQFAKVVRRLALYTADRIAVVLANEKLEKLGERRTDGGE